MAIDVDHSGPAAGSMQRQLQEVLGGNQVTVGRQHEFDGVPVVEPSGDMGLLTGKEQAISIRCSFSISSLYLPDPNLLTGPSSRARSLARSLPDVLPGQRLE